MRRSVGFAPCRDELEATGPLRAAGGAGRDHRRRCDVRRSTPAGDDATAGLGAGTPARRRDARSCRSGGGPLHADGRRVRVRHCCRLAPPREQAAACGAGGAGAPDRRGSPRCAPCEHGPTRTINDGDDHLRDAQRVEHDSIQLRPGVCHVDEFTAPIGSIAASDTRANDPDLAARHAGLPDAGQLDSEPLGAMHLRRLRAGRRCSSIVRELRSGPLVAAGRPELSLPRLRLQCGVDPGVVGRVDGRAGRVDLVDPVQQRLLEDDVGGGCLKPRWKHSHVGTTPTRVRIEITPSPLAGLD